MELGLGNVVSEVLGARVGNNWAFNAQLRLDCCAEVLLKKSPDPLSLHVVTVILYMHKQLFLSCRRGNDGRFRGFLGGHAITRLDGLAGFGEQRLEKGPVLASLNETNVEKATKWT